MSKKKIIQALIEAGNPFEKVVELSKAKASYVKSQYTQLGLDWQAASIGEEDEQEVKSEESEVVSQEAEPVEAEVEQEVELPEEVEPKKPVELFSEEEAALRTKMIEQAKNVPKSDLVLPSDEKEPKAEEKDIKDEPWYPEYTCCEARVRSANSTPGRGLIKQRSAKYRAKVEKVLEELDFSPQALASVNSMYRCISPRPNNMNSHRHVYKLHKDVTNLFRKCFANR